MSSFASSPRRAGSIKSRLQTHTTSSTTTTTTTSSSRPSGGISFDDSTSSDRSSLGFPRSGGNRRRIATLSSGEMPMSSPQARSTPRNASLNQPEMSVEQASATSRNEYLGQVVEAQSRNTHLDNQVAKLRAELAKKNDQMEQQQTLISEYVSENRTKRSELEAKYADLGKRYEQLLGVLTSLEGSKMTLQERCAVVQREREAAEMKLNAQGKTLAAVSDSQLQASASRQWAAEQLSKLKKSHKDRLQKLDSEHGQEVAKLEEQIKQQAAANAIQKGFRTKSGNSVLKDQSRAFAARIQELKRQQDEQRELLKSELQENAAERDATKRAQLAELNVAKHAQERALLDFQAQAKKEYDEAKSKIEEARAAASKTKSALGVEILSLQQKVSEEKLRTSSAEGRALSRNRAAMDHQTGMIDAIKQKAEERVKQAEDEARQIVLRAQKAAEDAEAAAQVKINEAAAEAERIREDALDRVDKMEDTVRKAKSDKKEAERLALIAAAEADRATTDLRLKTGMVDVLMEGGIDEEKLTRIDHLTIEAAIYQKQAKKDAKITLTHQLSGDAGTQAVKEKMRDSLGNKTGTRSESDDEDTEVYASDDVAKTSAGYLQVNRTLRDGSHMVKDDEEAHDVKKKRFVKVAANKKELSFGVMRGGPVLRTIDLDSAIMERTDEGLTFQLVSPSGIFAFNAESKEQYDQWVSLMKPLTKQASHEADLEDAAAQTAEDVTQAKKSFVDASPEHRDNIWKDIKEKEDAAARAKAELENHKNPLKTVAAQAAKEAEAARVALATAGAEDKQQAMDELRVKLRAAAAAEEAAASAEQDGSALPPGVIMIGGEKTTLKDATVSDFTAHRANSFSGTSGMVPIFAEDAEEDAPPENWRELLEQAMKGMAKQVAKLDKHQPAKPAPVDKDAKQASKNAQKRDGWNAAGSDWEEKQSADGTTYFFNKRTAETVLEKPAALLTLEAAESADASMEEQPSDGERSPNVDPDELLDKVLGIRVVRNGVSFNDHSLIEEESESSTDEDEEDEEITPLREKKAVSASGRTIKRHESSRTLSRTKTSARLRMGLTLTPDQVVVMDSGSSYCRAGIGGEEMPRCSLEMDGSRVVGKQFNPDPTGAQKAKHARAPAAAAAKKPGGALAAFKKKGGWGKVRSRMTSMFATMPYTVDWDGMEQLWERMYTKELHVDPTDHSLVMSELPDMTPGSSIKLREIMFETFDVPSIMTQSGGILALYGMEKSTGLVVDLGNRMSITPVIDGTVLDHAIYRSFFAGQSLTEQLTKMLMTSFDVARGAVTNAKSVRMLKENYCYVAKKGVKSRYDIVRSFGKVKNEEKTECTVDGEHMAIGSELWRCPELLFESGADGEGLHKNIFAAVGSCEMDLRPALYDNIILAGGSACFPGLQERLEAELNALLGTTADKKGKLQVNISTAANRKYLTWRGGSKVAGNVDYLEEGSTWKEDWAECGDAIDGDAFDASP